MSATTGTEPEAVTGWDILSAADRIAGYVRHTSLLSSPFLDEIAGRRVLVKPECLQHTGSFKYRGARSALSAMPSADRRRGVIAYSSGNHAQGVARAAQEYGVPAIIIMPSDAPALKIANTRALGAEVVLYDRGREDRDALGAALAEERGLSLVKPFDDPRVIAGQGSAGLEIAADARALGIEDAEVLVCCGGGGLTSGIALALEDQMPRFRVRPVEPAGFDDARLSLEAGRITGHGGPEKGLCDAILTPAPGRLTFPILSRLCGPGLAVSDEEALRAMGLAFQRLKLVAEPGGAVALAAALFHGKEIEADTVIVTISGGNVDAGTFARALDTL